MRGNPRGAWLPARDLVEALPAAVLVVDAEGRIEWGNRTAASLFGYGVGELPGLQIEALVPDLLAPDGIGAGQALVAQRRGGPSIPVDVLAAALPDDPARRVLVLHDAASRIALEAGRADAERLDALSRLAGSIGHDMNNVLTAINGYADLVALELPPNSPMATEVAEIRSAGRRGATLIRRLMAFARRGPIHPTSVPLASLLAKLEPRLRELGGDRIALVIDVDPAVPPVLADAARLEDSIENLVTNAVEAITGPGAIRVSARSDPADPALATIEVADSGPGIDESIVPHLFTPFFTTKPSATGSGLGLASVHGFVVQSRGRIEVGTGPDGGASFRIVLPAANDAPASIGSAAAVAGRAVPGELVLVVEDIDSVRALARISLEREGYQVVEAAAPRDLDSALALAAGTPAAVVTDMVMPGMDGRSIARDLRRRFPGIAVVLVSGYVADGLASLGGSPVDDPLYGIDGAIVLGKPFDPAGLAAAVRQAIDRSPS